ncbi:hypothetical protein [Ohtaekwangia koreensis]|uniref:Uncharacterized protein n=1 Tax=Ohtaekwangia koreensis TaxID=688867 RepID=A0A1T5M825_9BACT|nr:hypothetical protein [Ohtaekwangia koreensis]SKC84402.1 hypothetical protein SAMN05660236_4772 [Ohtaekwangia koreensis]
MANALGQVDCLKENIQMTKPPKSIFDLIDTEDFRKKTAMYIGDKKITTLKSFIDGYFYATWTNDIEVDDKIRFDYFHDWVATQFKWKESTAGWCKIILDECKGDEELV